MRVFYERFIADGNISQRPTFLPPCQETEAMKVLNLDGYRFVCGNTLSVAGLSERQRDQVSLEILLSCRECKFGDQFRCGRQ